MSSVVARRIIATPARHASRAWAKMVDLLAPDQKSSARKELESIAGIASSLISEEAFKNAPAVFCGKGARVRLYCLYSDDAISGEDASEAALATVPTEEEWKMSLPCPVDDLEWVQVALKNKSTRITARNLSEPLTDEDEDEDSQPMISSAKAITINRKEFFRS
jgi:hypothetical protein